MATKLEPRGDRLLVVPIEEERVTDSGIILPEQAREKPQRGRIVELGPKVNEKRSSGMMLGAPVGPPEPNPDDLAIGDEVLYSKYGGTELKVDGEEVILLREVDIFCRVHEDEPADDTAAVQAAVDAANGGKPKAKAKRSRAKRGVQTKAHAGQP